MPTTDSQESEGTVSWLKERGLPLKVSRKPYSTQPPSLMPFFSLIARFFLAVTYGYKFACTPSTFLMQPTFIFIHGDVIHGLFHSGTGGGVIGGEIPRRCEERFPSFLASCFLYCYINSLYFLLGISVDFIAYLNGRSAAIFWERNDGLNINRVSLGTQSNSPEICHCDTTISAPRLANYQVSLLERGRTLQVGCQRKQRTAVTLS